MTNITINLNVLVEGGPQVNFDAPITIPVGAYDPIEVSIDSGEKIVDVQPGEKVSFLLIKSSVYSSPSAPPAEQLTYQVDDKAVISLDKPQIFLGQSSIKALLGKVNKIKFVNGLKGEEKAASIEILVGRDPTFIP